MKKYSKGMDKMKLMRTEDAVGQVLCHDITQIIKGVTKDAVFRKGHIITEEDIPVLLSVGKDHIYICLLYTSISEQLQKEILGYAKTQGQAEQDIVNFQNRMDFLMQGFVLNEELQTEVQEALKLSLIHI